MSLSSIRPPRYRTFLTLMLFFVGITLVWATSAFAPLPVAFLALLCFWLAVFGYAHARTSSARRRANTVSTLLGGEAIVCPSPSGTGAEILCLATETEHLTVMQGWEEVAKWRWESITDISVSMECFGAFQFAGVTVHRGEESDTILVLNGFGIPSSTRGLVLADNLRRFCGS